MFSKLWFYIFSYKKVKRCHIQKYFLSFLKSFLKFCEYDFQRLITWFSIMKAISNTNHRSMIETDYIDYIKLMFLELVFIG